VRHPLARIQPGLLGSLTIRFGALIIFATALMMFVDVPLQGESSPHGIISFELAGTPHRALRILLEWKSRNALGYARLSIVVDFVYLVIYAFFFNALALWLGARLGEKKWSVRAAWAATAAAAFDILENGALLYELNRFTSPTPYPQLATSFALAKFTLLLFSAVYGIVGAIILFARRQRRPL
jgi:hypothetical protein